MTRLMFAPVPNGPLPLFLGEPRDDVSAQGHLCCDHATKTVFFRPADPFEQHRPLSPSKRHRFSTWEVDAMMPRRQVVGLYEEVKPLIERLDEGTTLRLTEQGWVCTRTPEADVAHECIDAALDVEVDAPVVWAPATSSMRITNTRIDIAAALQALSDAIEKSRVRSTRGKVEDLRDQLVRAASSRPAWGNGKTATLQAGSRGARVVRNLVHYRDKGPGSRAHADDAGAYAAYEAKRLIYHRDTSVIISDVSAFRRFNQFLY